MQLVNSRADANLTNSTLNNQYVLLHEGKWTTLPIHEITDFGWGIDYYTEVLRVIEERGQLKDLTFYISKSVPETLPITNNRSVLLAIGDEYYETKTYFRDLLAVLRCYGDHPCYLDSWPTNPIKRSAFLQFLLKIFGYYQHRLLAYRILAWRAEAIRPKTLWVPLGCFNRLDHTPLDFETRSVDYAFLGSVEYEDYSRLSPQAIARRIIPPPKIAARIQMKRILSEITSRRKDWRSVVQVTKNFTESIENTSSYASTLADCKISLCPRGSNYETYRFNESCKMGCVIVCEPIPKTWFYEEHPAIVIRDWSRLSETLELLLNDPAEMKRRSLLSRRFWETNLSESSVAIKIESFLIQKFQLVTTDSKGLSQVQPLSR